MATHPAMNVSFRPKRSARRPRKRSMQPCNTWMSAQRQSLLIHGVLVSIARGERGPPRGNIGGLNAISKLQSLPVMEADEADDNKTKNREFQRFARLERGEYQASGEVCPCTTSRPPGGPEKTTVYVPPILEETDALRGCITRPAVAVLAPYLSARYRDDPIDSYERAPREALPHQTRRVLHRTICGSIVGRTGYRRSIRVHAELRVQNLVMAPDDVTANASDGLPAKHAAAKLDLHFLSAPSPPLTTSATLVRHRQTTSGSLDTLTSPGRASTY